VLRDMGMLDFDEPFTNLLCQGMVLDEHGDVMSKSKGNVVSPEAMIDAYGTDAVRAAMLFMGPPEKEKLWNEDSLAGIYKFLVRVWRQVHDLMGQADEETLFAEGALASANQSAADVSDALLRARHGAVGKATKDIERNQFNTAIAAIMELSNATGDYLRKLSPEMRAADPALSEQSREVAEVLVKLLAPACPHMADELWHKVLGHTDSVHKEAWPEFDPALATADTVELAVQVCGKIKARIMVAKDAVDDDIKAAAREAIAESLAGKTIVKEIVVPGRLVNIVAK
jgi:leucyl-tRNA synthetase